MSRGLVHHPGIDEWYPEERPPPPEGEFEIGLVLAGAVSAGAYTAGVLDFVIEALDAWCERRKAEEPLPPEQWTVPRHRVRLRAVAGTSAGGMNGAIMASALRGSFPHARGPGDPGLEARWGNPFYRAWVKEIDVRHLLDMGDLDRPVFYLFNGDILRDIVDKVLSLPLARVTSLDSRDWIENPLPILMTVTNLCGVPYGVALRGEGNRGHVMRMHADHMLFVAPGLSGRSPVEVPPDARVLPRDIPDAEAWQALGEAALATGAFPVALNARRLARKPDDYLYRNIVWEDGEATLDRPAWPDGMDEGEYRFLTVDGGVMNNEPIELARRFLAGQSGRNPRKGVEANRGIVMIDPFVEPVSLGLDDEAPLPRLAGAVLDSLISQARFTPRDLALMKADEVYSRYLVAPSRDGGWEGSAVAGGGLGAFLGFFSEAYRHHDFMLGRRNAQRFLQSWFVLPETNPLFSGRMPADGASFRSPDFPDHIQIIPLVGACAEEQAEPRWPAGEFRLGGDLETMVDGRINGVSRRLVFDTIVGDRSGIGGWAYRQAARFIAGRLAARLRTEAHDKLNEAVAKLDARG